MKWILIKTFSQKFGPFKTRISSNVDEWIHGVADEDDRDDIRGWAEKVKSGKMTEEKFQRNVMSKTSD